MVAKGPSIAMVQVLILVTLLPLLLYLPSSSGVITGTPPPSQGDWVVDENTTVVDEEILLNGNLIVTNASVLSLTNVTLMLNSTFEGEFSIIVEANSTLEATDSTFTPGGDYSFGFIYLADSAGRLEASLVEYADGSSEEGLALYSSQVEVLNSTLRQATNGAVVYAPANLANNTLSNNSVGVALVEGLAANDVAADNLYADNSQANVRYYVEAGVRLVNQTGANVEGAQAYLNDTNGQTWLSGVSTTNGRVGETLVATWQVTSGSVNESLEPYNLSATKYGRANASQVYPSQGPELVLELPLYPDLVVESTGFDLGIPEVLTSVPAGRYNGTQWYWTIRASDQDAPPGWNTLGFDDSGWTLAPAPFGDRNLGGGVNYNTSWEDNNIAYFRHYFTLPEDLIPLGGTLSSSANDFGSYYVNSQLIFSDWRRGGGHGADYWNDESPVSGSLFNPGQTNLVAALVEETRNSQWFDAQLEVTYIPLGVNPLVRKLPAVVLVEVENQGAAEAQGVQVSLYNGSNLLETVTTNLPVGQKRTLRFDWTPKDGGNQTLTVKVDENQTLAEENETNNDAAVTVPVGTFGVNLSGKVNFTAIPFNQSTQFNFTVQNVGDLSDNVTLTLRDLPTGWQAEIAPQRHPLEPGQTNNLTLTVQPERSAPQGNYTFTLNAISSYRPVAFQTLVPAGRDNATRYSYEIYDNENQVPSNWYQADFNASNWRIGAAPFGNRSNAGLEPLTNWQTTNLSGNNGDNDYLVVRHYFTYQEDIPIIGAAINLAYNNYYAAYINGHLIRNCLSYSGGCYQSDVKYWNRLVTFDKEWLVEGQNVLAVMGRDGTYQGGDSNQWLDMELIVSLQVGDNREVTVEILPTHDFVLVRPSQESDHPIGTTQVYEIDIYNHGNLDEVVEAEMELVEQVGNWTVELLTQNITIGPDRSDALEVEVFGDDEIWIGDHLNLTFNITSPEAPWLSYTYYLNLSTGLPPDNEPPQTAMVSLDSWVRHTNVTLGWEVVEDNRDTVKFHIYYRYMEANGTLSSWQLWDSFPVQTTSAVFPAVHGRIYYFYSLGQDYQENLEMAKETSETWFRVDLEPPRSRVWIQQLGPLVTEGVVNTTVLDLFWEPFNLSNDDDIDSYTLQYRVKPQQGNFSEWLPVEELTGVKFQNGQFNGLDEHTYQFRSIATDKAGWVEAKSGWEVQVSLDATPSATWVAPLPPLTVTGELDLGLGYADKNDTRKLELFYTKYAEGSPPNEYIWQPAGTLTAPALLDSVPLTQLTDGWRYLFRTLATDNLGNRETREGIVEYFEGNGTPGQVYLLDQLPLPAPFVILSHIQIQVDKNLDGNYEELTLTESFNWPLSDRESFYVDYDTGVIHFGDSSGGFIPLSLYRLKVTYDGYSTWTVVDTSPPYAPEPFNLPVLNEAQTQVSLSWPKSFSPDVTSYRLEQAPDREGPWSEVMTLPAPTESEYVTALVTGLSPNLTYYFHAVAIDRAGWESPPNSALIINAQTSKPPPTIESPSDNFDPTVLLSLVAVLGLAMAGVGALLYQRRSQVAGRTRGPGLTPSTTLGASKLVLVKEDEAQEATAVVAEVESVESAFEPAEGSPGELTCTACGTFFEPSASAEEVTCPGCGQTGEAPSEETKPPEEGPEEEQAKGQSSDEDANETAPTAETEAEEPTGLETGDPDPAAGESKPPEDQTVSPPSEGPTGE